MLASAYSGDLGRLPLESSGISDQIKAGELNLIETMPEESAAA
jgi:hypothetical protein